MYWQGKQASDGLSQDRLAARARVRLEAKVDGDLAGDPAFRVRTIDRRHWICPYTLTVVPCPPDTLLPARTFLLERQPWTGRGRPRPLAQVLTARWRQHLDGVAADDPRFTTFDGSGRWRNPYTGTFQDLARPHQHLDGDARRHIAQALAQCAAAQAAAG